jgi:hypothetical protein
MMNDVKMVGSLFVSLMLIACSMAPVAHVNQSARQPASTLSLHITYPGAVAAKDLDGDGIPEVTFLNIDKLEQGNAILNLNVYWDYVKNPAVTPTRLQIPSVYESYSGNEKKHLGSRSTSQRTIAIADFDNDGRLDIGTSSGLALQQKDHSFKWIDFPEGSSNPLKPVVSAKSEGVSFLIRGTNSGKIEKCNGSGSCMELIRSPNSEPILDLVAGDFDGDGLDDIAGGYNVPIGKENNFIYTPFSYLFLGKNKWQNPSQEKSLDAVQMSMGDVNGDGIDDMIAQDRTFTNDSPSSTSIFMGSKKGHFKIMGQFANKQNHNDNMEVGDFNGDGCIDFAQIGVDSPIIAIKFSKRLGQKCSPDFKSGYDKIIQLEGTDSTYGIQYIDVTGDGKKLFVLRRDGPVDAKGFNDSHLDFVEVP